jgi:hypothetical protein
LDDPAAKEQSLAEESGGEPNGLDAHGQARGEGLEARRYASRLDKLADSFAQSGIFFFECPIDGSIKVS